MTHSPCLIVVLVVLFALLCLSVGGLMGQFGRDRDIERLHQHLQAHESLLIHPGAALSTVVQALEKRVEVIEATHEREQR